MQKGDICFANLAPAFGHEQAGERPALVLAVTDTRIVVVVPLTSHTEALRFPHTFLVHATTDNGLEVDSVALLFHIRAIDARRIERVCGRLEPVMLKHINAALKRLLNV